ncbi:hypothetical protein LINPERHAP1_LOCUS15842, partial [Linum perenne]
MKTHNRPTPLVQSTEIPCFCGVAAVVRRSRTSMNPDRAFYGCPNWDSKKKRGCGFFKWCDDAQTAD